MVKQKEKSKGPEREGISPALWMVPILAIIILLYYFSLSMGFDWPTFGRSMDQLKYGSVIVLGALLGILAVSHALDRRASVASEDDVEETDVEEVEEVPAPKPKTEARNTSVKAPAPAPKSPETSAKPAGKEVFEYPPKVSGGIYADSHLSIGEGRFLKLRTMIARSCLLCDEQGKCWDIVRTDVEQEFFASNIDCKEGLKIES